MRQALTAVLERDTTFTGDFATEPYEVAWAGEARFFVHTLATSAGCTVRLVTQISPDGLTWCDLDGEEHLITGPGLVTWPVSQFGQWLRLRGTLTGETPSATLRIYLAAKS
ncbi:MAG: hypothetical protein IRZ05_09025 [Micromonosporaceae bacterium]|jgi:hypothetical protein|nr:hypothetical protein [uncultured bacterium]MBX6355981.1 hypothetical protein [Micromonosporaceae bacterium]